ncbi:MAG: serine/threonine-protein kinase [Actinomycetaceae bacterium]|nr:serine/threonine-protein kinase [Actinomycetaceae bacterium]
MNVAIPNAGDELGGYRLLRPLGKGGAGIVWEVSDEEGSRFALKLLHPALAADPASRVRLAREAAVLNRIRSDGVAHVVDIETEAAQPFVVTELIDGLDLREELKRTGAMGFAESLRVARSLKDTLSAVHVAGVIHRDLKPSNIILGVDQPVIIDFGIAQADEDERLTTTGLVSGTPGWVAPEVLRGSAPDEGSDWWAWAAILLNMLTGRPPYGLGGNEVVVTRQLAGQLDFEGLYPPVARVLYRALGPREMRISADEVLAALEEFDPETVDNWASSGSEEATTYLGTAGAAGGLGGAGTAAAAGFGAAGAVAGTAAGAAGMQGAAFADSDYTEALTSYPDSALNAPVNDGETRQMPIESADFGGQGFADDGAYTDSLEPYGYDEEEFADSSYAGAEGETEFLERFDAPAPGEVEQTRVYPAAPAQMPPVPQPQAGYGQPGQEVGWPAAQPPAPLQGQPVGAGAPVTDLDGGFAQWKLPYAYKIPPKSYWFAFGLGTLLAALPVTFGYVGALIAVVVLIALETLGYSRAWRERRRVRAGEKRKRDNWLASLVSVPYLLRAAIAIAFNVSLAVLIAVAAWTLYSLSAGGLGLDTAYWRMLTDARIAQDYELVALGLLWASNAFAVMLARLGPGGLYLREGTDTIADSFGSTGKRVAGLVALLAGVAILFFV